MPERFEVIDITPAIAKEWLDKYNNRNRRIRQNLVDSYARDMAAENWSFNGEAIKRGKDGSLLDGQHRLLAIIKSGVTIPILVIWDLEPDAQTTMDTGAQRQFSDQLGFAGERHTKVLAAIARRVQLWERGNVNGGSKITHSELREVLEIYPELRDSAEVAARVGALSRLQPSVVGLCHFLFSKINQEQAMWFFARLGDGAGLPAGHPVLTLRERVRRERELNQLTEFVALALVILAWNAFRRNQPMIKIQLPAGGLTAANFPKPR